jgi:hypothetical protein
MPNFANWCPQVFCGVSLLTVTGEILKSFPFEGLQPAARLCGVAVGWPDKWGENYGQA